MPHPLHHYQFLNCLIAVPKGKLYHDSNCTNIYRQNFSQHDLIPREVNRKRANKYSPYHHLKIPLHRLIGERKYCNLSQVTELRAGRNSEMQQYICNALWPGRGVGVNRSWRLRTLTFPVTFP